ncbi:hypothetical protein EBQ93_02895 [bacterium]|nr:hypothetical protein [bacterium]
MKYCILAFMFASCVFIQAKPKKKPGHRLLETPWDKHLHALIEAEKEEIKAQNKEKKEKSDAAAILCSLKKDRKGAT